MAKGFWLYLFDWPVPGYLGLSWISTSPSMWRWAVFPTSLCGWIQQQDYVGMGVVDICGPVWQTGGVTRGRQLNRRAPEENNLPELCRRLTGVYPLALQSEFWEMAGASGMWPVPLHSGPSSRSAWAPTVLMQPAEEKTMVKQTMPKSLSNFPEGISSKSDGF